MENVNVLGFSACTMPRCDCGCRVVLGLTHMQARELVKFLVQKGYKLESFPVTALDDEESKKTVKAEPFTSNAGDEFAEYVTN